MSKSAVVRLSCLAAPEAPLRRALDSGPLEDLAASIRALGVLQPLVVKAVALGYEVIAGHRRLLACRMVGLDEVPVVVVDGDDEFTRAVMLAENVVRADLSPVEEAQAARAMCDLMGLSISDVAHRVGKSEAWVRGRLELLMWPELALRAIASGDAKVSALRPLVGIPDAGERDRLLECAIASGATAAVTRGWAAQVAGEAFDGLEGASSRAQAVAPLVDVVVNLRCFGCEQMIPAVALAVVRICEPCLDTMAGEVASRSQPSDAVG